MWALLLFFIFSNSALISPLQSIFERVNKKCNVSRGNIFRYQASAQVHHFQQLQGKIKGHEAKLSERNNQFDVACIFVHLHNHIIRLKDKLRCAFFNGANDP